LNKFLNLYNNNNIENWNFKYYDLFKKKKKNDKIKKINYFNLFKIIYFFNLYMQQYLYIDLYFFQYNIIRNYWYFLILSYNKNNNKLKIKMQKFFNLFCKKYIVKNFLNMPIKKKFFIIFNLLKYKKIKKIYKLKKTKLDLIRYKKKKEKKIIKITEIIFFINRKLKQLLLVKKNKKIKIPLLIFSKYKKKIFIKLIRYFIKFFYFDLKKFSFISFWIRWYKYLLKHIYIYIKYVIYKLMFLLKRKDALFDLLISSDKNFDKNLFSFSFFFWF
jgi:hypothetical protein